MAEETWDWWVYKGLLKAHVSPFLKWAGGKSQLLEHLRFPAWYSAYHEPFLGGGAIFFALQPRAAFLSDSNRDLINTYLVLRDKLDELLITLRDLESEYSENKYDELRSQIPEGLDSVDQAARFIFLNKTCYNGLYRVNRKGEFNVPFGRYKNPNICDEVGLRAANGVLRSATVRACDFREALKDVRTRDFVYLDPPYVPVSKTSRFTEYTSSSFTWSDQEALADEAVRLRDEIDCFVLMSNSYQRRIKQLYEGLGFKVRKVRANRTIGSRSSSRGQIHELLISNF